MDHDVFDRLARGFAAAGTRRAALGALLGTGLTGIVGRAAARKQRKPGQKRQKRKGKTRSAARVSAEAADCLSPGPSANLNGCNFNNDDLAGADLSSSAMRGATFRGANLCGADLSSSQLKRADFRGFAAPGNATNLFRADLSSSGCSGTKFNSRTLFCRTKTCNGSFRDDDCPAGVDPQDMCCLDADCPNKTCQRRRCQNNQCAYTPISGDTGPGCQTVCCADEQGEPVCCDAGTTTCDNGACVTDDRTVSLSFDTFDQFHTHCWVTVHVTGFAEGSYTGVVGNGDQITISADADGNGSWTSRTINTIWQAGDAIEATVDGVSSDLVDVTC